MMISFFIIVPTRNSHHLLPNLVQSLIEQTHNLWRVHFIDGQSEHDHCEYLEMICRKDSRFSWHNQISHDTGIFGAMNEGITYADLNRDWILFWGSDDLASSPLMLELIAKKLRAWIDQNNKPDLLICNGTYYQAKNNSNTIGAPCLGRKTNFHLCSSYRRSLFLGSTPPHQATFFGSGALMKVHQFTTFFKLAADLDYFLKLSADPNVNVIVEDEDIVLIGDGGVSNIQTTRRLHEVRLAYKIAFRNSWWIPFSLRYLQRIQSLIRVK